jgi:hypothetical protein
LKESVAPTVTSYPARRQKKPTSALQPQSDNTDGGTDSALSEQGAVEREDPDSLSDSGLQHSDEQHSAESDDDKGV